MFIKFGDKTKKMVVKSSKKDSVDASNAEEEGSEHVVYMDDNTDNRRVDALKKYNSSKKLHKTSE